MTGILITACWFAILLFIIRKVKFFTPEKIPFQLVALVFTVKCAGAVLIGLVYTFYYKGGDTFVLFNDSSILFNALKSNPTDYFRMLFGIDAGHLKEMYYSKMNAWYNNEFDILFNDARTVIRIHAVARIFSFGEYYVHALFFCFMSFMGLTALYKTFSPFIKKHHEFFYAGVLLVPSLIFWGSAALKEAVVLFAAGFIVYSSWQLITKKSFAVYLMLIASIFLLLLTRFYFLVALIPGLAGFLLAYNGKSIWKKFAITHGVWFVALFSFSVINPSCDVPCIMSAKQSNFVTLALYSKSGSILTTEKLKPEWGDIIAKSPSAFFTTLTKPLSFHSGGVLFRITSLETLFILLLLVEAIILFRKPNKKDLPILLFCCSFIVITYTFLGLTTPVAGTLVRYKIIALPFLIFIVGYFISHSKLFIKSNAASVA